MIKWMMSYKLSQSSLSISLVARPLVLSGMFHHPARTGFLKDRHANARINSGLAPIYENPPRLQIKAFCQKIIRLTGYNAYCMILSEIKYDHYPVINSWFKT